ncbi:MAG TPA: hypothetical protein VHT27_03345 [Solirubrobacteraceae bacterium]|jgi:hypothetical protein|nr:hypothetical protein [Solirubrobacteraceae bacterium]
MAKHEVGLQVEQEIPILNRNIVVPVRRDGKAFGRLRVSKGGIDWMAAGAQKKHHHLTWDRVAELLREHGTEYD